MLILWARLRPFLLLLVGLAVLVNSGFSQTLSVTAGVQSVTIHPGDTNVSLSVTLGSSSYSGPVSVTLTGLPSGISVAPLTLSPGASGTLQLSASPSADQEAFLGGNNVATSTVTVLAFAGAMQVTASVALTVSLQNPSYSPEQSQIDLPILRIDTGGVGIVDKTTKVPGIVTITSADGQTTYLPGPANSDNTATFHLHGNSTLLMPKKAYNMKLSTSMDLLSVMGLPCPYVNGSGLSVCDKSKSYVLLANYVDKTLLRDWSASALANAIPSGGDYLSYAPGSPSPSGTSTLMWWAPHSLFVELYLNGAYQGNYQLIEAIKIDSHRLNINEMDETDISGKSLTGGYLLEIDQRQDEDFVFTTSQGVPVGLDDPDFSPEVKAQTDYISNYVNVAENALFGPNYTDATLGWRAYFDEAAAVNFYLVNDVMGNVDGGAFFSSVYLYKDKNNPLLYMGPVWDFDISSGNINYANILNPTVPWMQTQAPWYVQWFSDPSFKASVVKQFNALKNNGIFTSWLASIDQQAAVLQQSQRNNFGRWPMQGIRVWPNAVAIGTYDGEVSYLTNWIKLRLGYLDAQFNNKAATATLFSVPAGALRAGSPASLNAQVTGGSTPGGTVTFAWNSVVLGTGTLNSSGSATLTTDGLPSGAVTLQAIYGGDSTNGLSASDPVQVNVLAPFISTTANLITSSDSTIFGTSITLTAAVAANSGAAVPTGTFTFSSNGTALGTATVSSSGIAVLTTTTLPVGSSSIQAFYSGDATYSASLSNTVELPSADAPVFSLASGTYSSDLALTITDSIAGAAIYYTVDGSVPTAGSTLYTGAISIGQSETIQAIAVASGYTNSAVTSATYVIPPGFILAIDPPSQAISFGESATFKATITPKFGFNQSISFSCSGLPADHTCSFSQSSVTPGSAPVTATLVVSTKAMASMKARQFGSQTGWAIGVTTALLLWPFRMRRMRRMIALMVLAVVSLSIAGCGEDQPHVVSISVVATGGGVTQMGLVKLTERR